MRIEKFSVTSVRLTNLFIKTKYNCVGKYIYKIFFTKLILLCLLWSLVIKDFEVCGSIQNTQRISLFIYIIFPTNIR